MSTPGTRQAILSALAELLESASLEDINVAEVLRTAGLASRATFYRHFDNLDEAFVALAEQALAEVTRVVDTVVCDPVVRRSPELRWAVTLWMGRGARRRGLTANVLRQWPRIPELKAQYLAFMDDLVVRAGAAIEADRRAGLVVSEQPGERLAAMIFWAADRAVHATLMGAEGFEDSHAVADVLVATHLAATYGAELPKAKREAARAAWLMV